MEESISSILQREIFTRSVQNHVALREDYKSLNLFHHELCGQGFPHGCHYNISAGNLVSLCMCLFFKALLYLFNLITLSDASDISLQIQFARGAPGSMPEVQ